MLGLLRLRIFEATSANIANLTEHHGHRALRVHGKGDKTVLVPLPPAVGCALDRAIDHRADGPILHNRRSVRLDCHAAARRLHQLAAVAGVCLRHTFVTTCSTPASTCATSKSPPATPTPAPPCATTEPDRSSTTTPTRPRRLHGLRHMTCR